MPKSKEKANGFINEFDISVRHLVFVLGFFYVGLSVHRYL
jgi:hypothetical protein